MMARSGTSASRGASGKNEPAPDTGWRSGAVIRIASADLSAEIDPLGAELSSLRDAQGRELMTDADPAFWAGRAPLLFPIVGALNGGRYRLGHAEYALPQHGFARRRTFSLCGQASDRAVFRLEEDEATRAAYPFAFALEAAFEVTGATLTTAITVANRGDTDMPASFGFHPAFAWPLPYGRARADHRLVFAREEPAPIRAIEGGLIGAEKPGPLDGRMLRLDDSLFANDALVWDRFASESVTYGAEDGPQLEIAFPGAPMLGIWTKPGARFVCIEPWWGIADPVGFDGEIWDKPGMMRFAPGEARTFTMRVTLRP
jgi:galactose mutarotase-like enzyme